MIIYTTQKVSHGNTAIWGESERLLAKSLAFMQEEAPFWGLDGIYLNRTDLG